MRPVGQARSFFQPRIEAGECEKPKIALLFGAKLTCPSKIIDRSRCRYRQVFKKSGLNCLRLSIFVLNELKPSGELTKTRF